MFGIDIRDMNNLPKIFGLLFVLALLALAAYSNLNTQLQKSRALEAKVTTNTISGMTINPYRNVEMYTKQINMDKDSAEKADFKKMVSGAMKDDVLTNHEYYQIKNAFNNYQMISAKLNIQKELATHQ